MGINQASGNAQSSFATDTLRTLDSGETYYQEDTVKNCAATMYSAGADTTISALTTFVLAMLANPEAQRKAQEEIDSVVGRGQLPDFEDEEALPYLAALVKEVLRWRNVAPFGGLTFNFSTNLLNDLLGSGHPGVPHLLAVEDEYRGYRIPAGSLIISNIW
jgi:cytochrome P450